jgi:hypothetical protein
MSASVCQLSAPARQSAWLGTAGRRARIQSVSAPVPAEEFFWTTRHPAALVRRQHQTSGLEQGGEEMPERVTPGEDGIGWPPLPQPRRRRCAGQKPQTSLDVLHITAQAEAEE